MNTKFLIQTDGGGHEFQETGLTVIDRYNFDPLTTAERDALTIPTGTIPFIYNSDTAALEIKAGATWYKTATTADAYSRTGNAFGMDVILGTTDAFNVKFYSNNVERMRLLSGGALIIGGTTATGTEKLKVAGDTRLEGTATITGAVAMNADVEIGAGYTNGGGLIRMMNLYGHISIGPLVKLLPDSNATIAGNIYIGDAVARDLVVDASIQDYNTLMGAYVLRVATNQGRFNTIVGGQAGLIATLFGDGNTIIGSSAFANQTGLGSSDNNTIVGHKAGYDSVSSASIFLGYEAGRYETGNNKLFIHNSLGVTTEALGRTQSLIYGVMTGVQQTQTLTINGSMIVGSAALPLNATGGFLYIPSCPGTPVGTPTTQTGTAPLVWDSTNKKLYIWDGTAWKGGVNPGVFTS